MVSSQPDPVVQIRGLSRRFGRTAALQGVDLTVPRGVVFGLVGSNGAGKTTLLKHVLGMLRAHEGTVRVFGRDPVADPPGVLSRIGYVSEEHDLPDWMRIWELLRYTQAFYSGWDTAYAQELRGRFGLEPNARIRELSRGQRARAALLVALAHRPELLVLDEPSSGLDPLVRRDILEAIIRSIADEGRTVLFSSHLLHEVERVADHVALIDQGRVVLDAPLDDLLATHRRWTVRFAEAQVRPPALAGVLSWEGAGHEWTAVYQGEGADFPATAARHGAQVLDKRVPSLDEIFVARVGTRPVASAEVES